MTIGYISCMKKEELSAGEKDSPAHRGTREALGVYQETIANGRRANVTSRRIFTWL